MASVPLATAPEKTTSPPPKLTVAADTVPRSCKRPPLDTLIWSATPPASTFNSPPLEMVLKESLPPASTLMVPPEIPVPEFSAPLTTPPDETISRPPERTPTLVTVPSTFRTPPLDTPRNEAEPPASTLTVPPEIPVPAVSVPVVKPPDEIFSTPPEYTPTLPVTVPATFSLPPLETLM